MAKEQEQDAFAKARDEQQAWKREQIMAYATAFVQAGLALYRSGVAYVGSDDVDEGVLHPDLGSGIAGSAITMLRNASVITDYFGSHRDVVPPVNGGRRRSKNPTAHCRKINVYRLTSVYMAEAWLERNKVVFERAQKEMALE